jgi:hypothetical protein
MTFGSKDQEVEMKNKYRDAKHSLVAISEEVYDYAYNYYSLPAEWDEADIFITSKPFAIEKSDAGRLLIVTSAAPQIAWLFGRLRDAFAGLGDGGLETHHYLRLTGAARAYELTADGDYKVNGILREVMNEAFLILEELENDELARSRSKVDTDPPSVPTPQAAIGWQEAVVC